MSQKLQFFIKMEILKSMQMTIKKIANTVIILAVFLGVFTNYAQGEYIEVRDLETWSSIHLKYKVNKKWKMALQGQLRMDNNSSEVSQYFGQFRAIYSPFKHFDFAGAIRYIKKNDNTGNIQGYEDHFRYQLDGIVKHKVNSFSFKYRFRYQNKNEIGVDDDSKQYIRLKIGADYNIRKWKLDPEFSGELFNSIGTDNDNKLEGFRLTLGTSFKLHTSGKVGVYYRFEEELNTEFPKSRNIIGLKYIYTLK